MKRGTFIVLGIVVYGAALVAFAPATLLDGAMRRGTDGVLRVAEARGSAWSGGGYLELVDKQYGVGITKEMSWRLRGAALWRGDIVYEIKVGGMGSAATVSLMPSRVEVDNAVIEMPASAIGMVAPQLAPAQLTGDLVVTAPHVSVAGGAMRGQATVRWRNAGSGVSPVAPLGEYEMQIQGDEAGVHARLVTLRGPLQLEGRGSWGRQSPAVFSAVAAVEPEYSQRLTPLLQSIARESGTGAFRLVVR